MNDDLLTPKSQPIPVESDTTPAPNDTEEQDTVSDRVYDFTDGDIKPVSDLDGPVTHKVNLEIAEALRNPSVIMKSMKAGTPVVVPHPIQTPVPTRAPINKLEPIPAPPLSSTPKPIPHPPIDPAMQAPAVKVYSQVPHASTQTPSSTAPAQLKPSEYKSPITPQQPSAKFVTAASSAPKPPVEPVTPSAQKAPESPASAAALQEILRKVHSQTQAAPPTIKENLLDKNIGSLQATPFAAPTNASSTTPPAPIPPKDAASSTSKSRTTPYNPPSKVIGARMSDYIADPVVPPKPTSLQDAVSSVLPGDNKPNTPRPFQNQSGPFKPLRTYEGDVAEAMSHRKISTASIAIAETKKEQGEERISENPQPKGDSRTLLKIVMALLILILLGGGAFAGYYLYSKSPLATSISNTPPQQQGRPGIVRADSYAVIPIDNQLPATLFSRIQAEAAKVQTPGTIKEIILARKTASSNTATFTQIGAPEAITGLDISVPDILNRTITADWMLGIYTSPANDKGAFVIVTTNFFQNAFAGMLQWEATMADDLKQFVYPSDSIGIANTKVTTVAGTSSLSIDLDSFIPSLVPSSTTTISINSTTTPSGALATSSPTPAEVVAPLRPYFTLRGTFEDRIIKNKDVRAFRTDTGTILFLYSFIDNTRLALASDEATLVEILTRLEKQALIR
jgi:hypothetical protein